MTLCRVVETRGRSLSSYVHHKLGFSRKTVTASLVTQLAIIYIVKFITEKLTLYLVQDLWEKRIIPNAEEKMLSEEGIE